jgi:CheY-like chemotaxis protein
MSGTIDLCSSSQHVMLLYDNDYDRNLASVNYINQGLKEKQLCVYASVDAHDSAHLQTMSLQVNNYDENINKRNLLVVDLKPFYDSALAGDLTPFENFKAQLLQELTDGGGHKGVLIVADCADYLSRNKHFEKCNMVEKWWQDSYVRWLQEQQQQQEKEKEKQNYSLNVICHHPGSILNRHPFEQYRNQISHNHSITMDAADCVFANCTSISSKPAGLSPFTSSFSPEVVIPPLRILVVEPDPDLQQVYGIWLSSMGFNAIITESGQKCLDEVVKATCEGEGKDKNQNEGFDLVILDTHLNDIPCVQVAKKIIAGKADQKIIFTSTMPSTFVKEGIVNPIDSINNNQILIKPFQLSDLLSLLDKGNKASNI